MKKHVEKTDLNEEEIKDYDKEFMKVSFNDIFELVLAANYLHISSLMDLLCQSIADRIKNKSVKAIKKILDITSGYTPEEEAEVRDEHKWAHEGVEFDESLD
ncbi:SKP1-like protein 20 [Lycium ferocissimum]|uniref:SKP1-like protein 20 n=1 Tax=Lycium ferocissimum TaxID=112874 RepID=UPI00281501F2|nr:SKP1-like protein 20 [Lycium ferocissimum]